MIGTEREPPAIPTEPPADQRPKRGRKQQECAREGCGARPSFNAPDETKGLYCTKHKLDGMIDVMNRTCPGSKGIACQYRKHLMKDHEFCAECDPDPVRARKRRRNEFRFFENMAKAGLAFEHEHPIHFRCEERDRDERRSCRLDGTMTLPQILVIAELDEQYHRFEAISCEVARQASANRAVRLDEKQPWDGPIAWVRVNPHRLAPAKEFGLDLAGTTPRTEAAVADAAAAVVRDLLANPRDGVFYVNFPAAREAELRAAMVR